MPPRPLGRRARSGLLGGLLLVVLALALVAADGEPQAGDGDRGQALALACAPCHALDGNSSDPSVPKLAGQVASQLLKQIRDIRSGARASVAPQCADTVEFDQDALDLAAWFSAQRAATESPDPYRAAAGEDLFRYGDPDIGLVACGGCHDRRGQGFEGGIPGGVPAIRSQHPRYIAQQLQAFQRGDRSNDWNGVMRRVATRLDSERIEDVSAFIAGLR